jgi:hypothetical protein
MSEYALSLWGTISGVVTALGTIVIVFLMLKERNRPAAERNYWPWLIALAVIVVVSLTPGYMVYRLVHGVPSQSIQQTGSVTPPSGFNEGWPDAIQCYANYPLYGAQSSSYNFMYLTISRGVQKIGDVVRYFLVGTYNTPEHAKNNPDNNPEPCSSG